MGVPKDHPLFGKNYEDLDVEVHCGLTFAGKAPGYVEGAADPSLHYFGFDCCHAWDFAPALFARESKLGIPMPKMDSESVYRDWEYVKEEVESLATQLAMVDQKPQKRHPPTSESSA